MSEDTQAPEGQEEQAPELSEVEVQAMELGWRPEEEFKADPKNEGKKWRSAEDFMDRKSLFDRIETGNHEVKQLKKTVQQLAEHNAKIEKIAYEKALAKLKEERKAALADNDLVRAEEIRDEMDEVKDKMQTVRPVPVVDEAPPALVEFKQRNTWYQRDDVMTNYADGLGNKLLAEGKSPDVILKTVEAKVREAFPEKFRNPNRESAPEMATSSKRADPTRGFEMSEQERKIMKNFVAQGIMTEEQYKADLKKLRG